MSRSGAAHRRGFMGTPATFEALRPHLMAVAYRMLGSAADAEDAVQDAWLRWTDVDEAAIHAPKAWLSTALGRLCLDRLKSAYVRRQAYVGPWLPEPVATREPVDVESITLGFLLLLERLSPLERVVFVLHHVFDHSHAEIAAALGSTDAAVRQAFHRAKEHIASERPRFAVSREDHERLVRAFLSAVTEGDVERMQSLLVEDAVLAADSAGKVRGAARKPVRGSTSIARSFAGFKAKLPSLVERIELEEINGWPALVAHTSDGISFVITFETDGSRIHAIRGILAPDKLRLPHID
jgi:RNA polymerase sigma-70 factor, ECF subfamily